MARNETAGISLDVALDDTPATVSVDNLIIAGWTSRDVAAMEAHIRELEELGVTRPESTPVFYRVAAAMLTTAGAIQVSGPHSSGEVEYVMLNHAGEWWVTVGSDHTDREAETVGVSLSKQMCHKPVGRTWWRFADVKDHWDELQLKSWIVDGEDRILYQDGGVAAMKRPEELAGLYGGLNENWAMFGGTLAAIGGVRPAPGFALELHDPVRNKTISHAYRTDVLPVEG